MRGKVAITLLAVTATAGIASAVALAQGGPVDATSGKEVWKTKVGEINVGSSVYSSPIVADETLFIATKDKVFSIKPGKKGEAAAGAGGGN